MNGFPRTIRRFSTFAFVPADRRRRLIVAACGCLCLLLSSCADDGRKPVYPVRGKVLAKGKPAAGAFIQAFPVVADKQEPLFPYATVADDGSFALSTYEQGDGVPAGEYIVTFQWLTYQVVGNQWSGPDKLGGRYSDKEESKFRFTVTDEPVELPTFELQ